MCPGGGPLHSSVPAAGHCVPPKHSLLQQVSYPSGCKAEEWGGLTVSWSLRMLSARNGPFAPLKLKPTTSKFNFTHLQCSLSNHAVIVAG